MTYTAEELGTDAVTGILRDWVAYACTIARAGLGTRNSDDLKARTIVDEIEHLQLAEPWLPAMQITTALELAGWTPPTES